MQLTSSPDLDIDVKKLIAEHIKIVMLLATMII